MKQYKPRSKESQFIDPEFAEALNENESAGRSSSRQAQRKSRQFCRQVQRALNLALAEHTLEDGIGGLFVDEVSPAPDCGRLLVHVFIPAGRSVAEAIAALRRRAPDLRSEVAAEISRKRAPELCFIPVSFEGGGDD